MKTKDKIQTEQANEPFTYSIPDAGKMVGLAPNGSYAAARRGEIPVMPFGGKKRVPGVKWRRIVAEGFEHAATRIEPSDAGQPKRTGAPPAKSKRSGPKLNRHGGLV